MTRDLYNKLPEKQKEVFKILFCGGVHTAYNIRQSIGNKDLNVTAIVKALSAKDKNVCSRWRYLKGRGYFKVYFYKYPGEWEK